MRDPVSVTLVVTNTRTHAKIKLSQSAEYNIDFDDDGVSAIVFGVQLDGNEFFFSDGCAAHDEVHSLY